VIIEVLFSVTSEVNVLAVFHIALDHDIDSSVLENALRLAFRGNPVLAIVEFKYERTDGVRRNIFELRVHQSGMTHSGVHPLAGELVYSSLKAVPGYPMVRQSYGR
jgi:hypothetical protein